MPTKYYNIKNIINIINLKMSKMSKIPMYSNFHRIEQPVGLKIRFLKIVSMYTVDNKNSKEHDNLGEILQLKNIELKFNEMEGHEGIFIVFVTCHLDRVLIDLAEKYDLPRGFPILWIPGKIIKFFGFYPKFKNDERQSLENVEEFKNFASISITLKISGFLGLLVTIKVGDEIFWTTTSKNSCSADSSFVSDAKEIFEPYVTTALLEEMDSRNITLCAEMLSKNDQKHGYAVKKNIPIITAISIGSVLDISPILQETELVDTVIDRFLTFMSPPEMFAFCDVHGLPHFSSYATMTNESSLAFMMSLGDRRDMMDFNLFTELYQCFDRIMHGNLDYFECIGDILEGLVMHITMLDGSLVTKKYKFPRYTIRTFVLRDIETSKSSSIDYFLENWVVTKIEKQYWRQMFFGYLITGISYLHDPLNPIAKHIMIADNTSYQSNYEQQWMQLCSNTDIAKEASAIRMLSRNAKHNVVLILGPFSLGKSTYGDRLAILLGPRFKHIDGDSLDFDNNTVSQIGFQRSEVSLSCIMASLMRGEVPIVSCGGGILTTGFKNKKTFCLREYVRKNLGIEINITTVIVSQSTVEREINASDANTVADILRAVNC